MITLLFALGWFVTACAYAYQAYTKSVLEQALWEFDDIDSETGWIDVWVSQPDHGQKIIGRNAKGDHWEETWDENEPIGYMTHWVPVHF